MPGIKIVPNKIKLSEDEIFMFNDGLLFDVEIVGERSETGIYINVEDTGKIFGYLNLDNDIKKSTSLKEEIHYKLFRLPKKKVGKTYFTYEGFITWLLNSRKKENELIEEFKDWCVKTLFTMHMGIILV
jgi:hypothetical protein